MINDKKIDVWKKKGYNVEPLNDLIIMYKIAANDEESTNKSEERVVSTVNRDRGYFKKIFITLSIVILIFVSIFAVRQVNQKTIRIHSVFTMTMEINLREYRLRIKARCF